MFTDQQRQQFVDEGYVILGNVIGQDHLTILPDACDHLIDVIKPMHLAVPFLRAGEIVYK